MAPLTYLDTHVAAWLFAGEVAMLSAGARQALEKGDLLASPAVLLELQHLYETKRVGESGDHVLDDLRRRIGLRLCDLPFADVAHRALQQGWTRDPFDRLIVAQAMLRDSVLVTKDRRLRTHYRRAVW